MGSDQLKQLALVTSLGLLLVGAWGMLGYPALDPPLCNDCSYDGDDDPMVQAVIDGVVNYTTGYFKYYNQSPPSDPVVWGFGTCSINDPYVCWRCLDLAAKEVRKDCEGRIGAQVTLVNCRLRYEFHSFRE